jgi:hypothetical protein
MGDVVRIDPGARRRHDDAALKRNRARGPLSRWLKAVDAAICTKKLIPTDGRLARELTNYPSANEGICWAGQSRLAGILGRSDRTVRYSLQRMRGAGFLRAQQQGRARTNCYVLCLGGEPIFPARSIAGGTSDDRQSISGHNRQSVAADDRQSIADKTLESESYERDFIPPTPNGSVAASGDTASGLPTKEDGSDVALDGDVLSPDSITFRHFWEASGMVGLVGPALAAWEKLPKADHRAIAKIILRDGAINTGGTWACTWLSARAWEQPPLPVVETDRRDTERKDVLNDFEWKRSPSSGPPMLAPYSDEWQAERARRVARHEPTSLMDDWAKRGMGWPCV